MTAGNNGSGANSPENDDPFAYLYRSEGEQGGQGGQGGAPGQAVQQPGVPRTSYNHVRAVGERQYGGAQAPGAIPRQSYGREPSAHYAAPETQPGGRAATRQHGAGAGHGQGRPPRSNGPLIAAVAVVAAVVIGVGAAILFSDDGSEDKAGGPDTTAAPTVSNSGGNGEGNETGDPKGEDKKKPGELPSGDAATFHLGGDPLVAGDVPGAKAESGKYVGMNKPGASATWTTEIAQAGQYRLYVGYGVPGKDMNLTLWVNGERQQRPLKMANFAKAPEGDWSKGWTQTWALVNVTEGSNEFKISCEPGNACEVNLDQVWVAENESQ